MKSKNHKVLFVVSFGLFLFGWAIPVGWRLVIWADSSRLSTMDFPLASHLVVATDTAGRIYVGDSFYGRIQRYSSMGEFEIGWFVDAEGGVFALRPVGSNQIEVATARNGILIYSTEGQLLVRDPVQEIYSRYSALDEIAGQYTVKGWLTPHIIDMRNGRIIVATPWIKRLIAYPFPSIAYAGVGFVLMVISDWQRRRGRARLRASPSE